MDNDQMLKEASARKFAETSARTERALAASRRAIAERQLQMLTFGAPKTMLFGIVLAVVLTVVRGCSGG